MSHTHSHTAPTDTAAKHSLLSRATGILLPLAITVALVWYMFTKIDFAQLWHLIRHGVDYTWILAAMGVSIFSHIFRAMRWRMQLRAMGINAPLMALSCSIFGTYALNLVFPRLGEVWRCSYIAKREKAPFTKVFGSMMADRLCDSITVLSLLLLTLLLAREQIATFLDKYPLGASVVALISSPIFWIAAICGGALLIALLYMMRHKGPVQTLLRWIKEVWSGFASIGAIRGKAFFILYTICIWGCYFLQLYLAFFAFESTRALIQQSGTAMGLLPALVAFVLSSIGMAVPSNGGLGPWNMCIIFALGMYGVAAEPATGLSIVVWSAQTIMLIILGIFTALYISKSPSKHTTLTHV